MTVAKTDVSNNRPETTDLVSVASGEVVFAETENNNNLAMMNPLIVLYNWVIDSGVELTAANVFTAIQRFNAGLKTDRIQSTSDTDTVYLGATGSNAGDRIADRDYVDTAISSLVGADIDLLYGDIQTGAFNAIVGTLYLVNTTSSAFTGTLPASPSNGDVIGFIDIGGNCYTNNFTIGRNGKEIMDSANDLDVNVNYGTVYLIYDSSEGSWYLL